MRWIADEYGYIWEDKIVETSYNMAKAVADAYGVPLVMRVRYDDRVTDWNVV